ncbi:hypothetical protein [Zunongwangia profunda]|uniref:hypothetical protein n=1 Tax=Zunongwangia profunda TaxID=398743 RepID=UPI001D181E2B|nr:hypothetical protein [Zunongwangia profunda]MCC4229388.1 hypothetical protein [Zunongwangia profunda]
MPFPKEEEFQKQQLLISKLYKLRSQSQEANSRLKSKEERSVQLKQVLEKEYHDVEQLDKLNLTALFYSILGNKDKKQEKERQEYLKAKLQYEEAIEEIKLIKRTVEQLLIEINLLKNSEEKYQLLLREKEEFLLSLEDESSKNLQGVIDDINAAALHIQEIEEVLQEAEPALHYLNETFNQLQSAESWGTFDMIGGGLLVTSIKHGKIDEARLGISKAQFYLDNLSHELRDVVLPTQLNESIDIGDFKSFGDYIFDGLIFDFIVQEKISKSKSHVQRVYLQVSTIEHMLKNQLQELQNAIKAKMQQKLQLLKN